MLEFYFRNFIINVFFFVKFEFYEVDKGFRMDIEDFFGFELFFSVLEVVFSV